MGDIVLIKNNRVDYGNVIESKAIGNSSKMENFGKKRKKRCGRKWMLLYQLKITVLRYVSLNRSWKSNHKKNDGKIGYSRNSWKKENFFKTIHRLSIIELIKINRAPDSYFFETPWNAILWNRIKINGKTSKLENADTVRNINLRQLKDNCVSWFN